MIKQYEFDFSTKKSKEVSEAPSYIPLERQQELKKQLGEIKSRNSFVYFWKKTDHHFGFFVTRRQLPDRMIPGVIAEHERSSATSGMSELILLLALASLGSGSLECALCDKTECEKNPGYQQK